MEPLAVLADPRSLTAAAISFFAAVSLTPLVIRAASSRGWVAHPKADRWHTKPTALMGGIAIYLAISAGWLFVGLSASLAWIWAGASLMFVVGLIDDRVGVSPVIKLLAQIAAAAVLVVGGYLLVPALPVWLSVPITLIWIIGITNAFNLLDNMDGLAAGIAAIAALTLALLLAVHGDGQLFGAALAVFAASAGFLLFNFKPASIFMGDSGSLVLGYSLAGLSVAYPAEGAGLELAALLFVPAAVMAVPILDTTLVTLRRILVGRRVSEGGRDHSSHRLVQLGLSEGRAVLTLYAVAALFGLLALTFQYTNLLLSWAVLTYALIGLAVFGVFLAGVTVYDSQQEELARRRLDGREDSDHVALRAALRNKRQIVGVLVDLLLVSGSLSAAWFLRFEDNFSSHQLDMLLRALPVVIPVKIAVFYAAGLYRGLWQYSGSHDAMRVLRSSAAASVVSVLGLLALYRFEGFSRSAFAIDWLITTGSLIAVRVAYRAFRQYFAERRAGRQVLIYGAGDAGSLALRELRQNHELGLVPVGFIDDDPGKEGRLMHGLPVVGGADGLPAYPRLFGVDEIIVAIARIDSSRRMEIIEACHAANIACRILNFTLGPRMEPGDTVARPSVVA
ncbi:MAG: glycosyl transferase [Gemmatimonadota bacterium]